MRSINISIFLCLLLTIQGCSVKPAAFEEKRASTPPPNPNAMPDPSTLGVPNAAPTLKPVVTAYYKAIERKDNAALKKVVSAHFIESLENAIKGLKTSIVEYLSATATPKRPLEVRNEIFYRGDAGVQVRDSNGGWTWMGFTREDDVWKVTDNAAIPMPEIPD